jgi:hypothetical protein
MYHPIIWRFLEGLKTIHKRTEKKVADVMSGNPAVQQSKFQLRNATLKRAVEKFNEKTLSDSYLETSNVIVFWTCDVIVFVL